jgi:hypothetical protein
MPAVEDHDAARPAWVLWRFEPGKAPILFDTVLNVPVDLDEELTDGTVRHLATCGVAEVTRYPGRPCST